MSWLLSVWIHEAPGAREALDEFDHQRCSEERLMKGTDGLKVKDNVIFHFKLKYTTIQNFEFFMFKIPLRVFKVSKIFSSAHQRRIYLHVPI